VPPLPASRPLASALPSRACLGLVLSVTLGREPWRMPGFSSHRGSRRPAPRYRFVPACDGRNAQRRPTSCLTRSRKSRAMLRVSW
jgi:hypothetical protein